MTILAILAAVVVIAVLTYNGLISKRVSCENGWSQIDVQLKRRHDLIPNLIETVKGYAAHEQQTLEAVIAARNAAATPGPAGLQANQIQAEQNLSSALRQLFAISENYPQLKANENFLKLQEELASTENKIGFARQNYNDCVAAYNAARQQVPGNLVIGFGSFPEKEFFDLDPTESETVKQAPKVSF